MEPLDQDQDWRLGKREGGVVGMRGREVWLGCEGGRCGWVWGREVWVGCEKGRCGLSVREGGVGGV